MGFDRRPVDRESRMMETRVEDVPMDEQLVGRVTHYFPKIEVAAVAVQHGDLRVGDTIRVSGSTSNFTQQVESMEIDRAAVQSAGVGDLVGIKVAQRARVNDLIYRTEHR